MTTWIEALVGRVDMQCKVCGTTMVAHLYGWPLTVCPQCFSAETRVVDRYPHGVLTEQEGGVPNDALDWDGASHVCRKHKVRERVCADVEMTRP